jgi:hypothetical protein
MRASGSPTFVPQSHSCKSHQKSGHISLELSPMLSYNSKDRTIGISCWVYIRTMGQSPVIPAFAGIHARGKWIPAYAGMTSPSVAWGLAYSTHPSEIHLILFAVARLDRCRLVQLGANRPRVYDPRSSTAGRRCFSCPNGQSVSHPGDTQRYLGRETLGCQQAFVKTLQLLHFALPLASFRQNERWLIDQ